jgi:tryptophan-rich sensory protein
MPVIDRRRDLLGLGAFLLLCLGSVAVQGAVTRANLAGWYDGLAKPPFTPPNWAFPLAWNLIFVLMAVAGWRVWRRPASPERSRALALFAVQLVLNFLWTMIFFGLHAVGTALVEVVLLWGVLLATLLAFARGDRWAARLLVPYLAWVAFAVALNAGIWWLNPAA